MLASIADRLGRFQLFKNKVQQNLFGAAKPFWFSSKNADRPEMTFWFPLFGHQFESWPKVNLCSGFELRHGVLNSGVAATGGRRNGAGSFRQLQAETKQPKPARSGGCAELCANPKDQHCPRNSPGSPPVCAIPRQGPPSFTRSKLSYRSKLGVVPVKMKRAA